MVSKVKFFTRFLTIIISLGLVTSLPSLTYAKWKLPENSGTKQLCSLLGGKEKHFNLDIDVYTFEGKKGEKVSITLSPDPSGSHQGEQATLILTSRFKPFFKIDRSSLPNKITTVLPATGEYFVYVVEQIKSRYHKSFIGSYCLTLESNQGAWKTFKEEVQPPGWSKHPITWIPERIEETLSRDTTRELKVAFISRIDLKRANLWITPELKPFISITPNIFDRIEAHTPYEVTLRLNIPDDTKIGLYDGTIHLRVGHRTYPETLKIKLNIIHAVNKPPIANAGPDQVIALPEGQTTVDIQLDGSGSHDPDGTITSYLWTGTPDPEDLVKPIVKLKQGIYEFTLQVTDDKGATSSDQTKVTVLGPPMLMPLPEVTGDAAIKIKGISIPGAIINVVNKNTGESKEVINEKGLFEIPFDLTTGSNEFEAVATYEGIQSPKAKLKTTYASSRNLIIQSISPSSGPAGSIVTITGSGFSPDPKIMGVQFIGPEIEGTGSRLESKGVVLEASETEIKVIVPFIFLKSNEEVEVYVYDQQTMSNSLAFSVVPAQDPTPEIKGNEATYQIDLILTQLNLIFNKLEQWTKPNIPLETWMLIEENMRRTQYFLETFKERVNTIPSEEVKANLDAIFGGEFFSIITQELEHANEILSHTTPCNIASVIRILQQILEPINTLNRVLDGIKDTLIGIQVGNGIACLFGCVPCCASIPFLYEIYSTVCAIDSVVDAIRSVFQTVIDMMLAAVPTIPSEWKVAVSGPFSGISNHILYTNTSSEIRLYANFTNAGFEQLINMGALRIDIPDPGGVFSILTWLGLDIESAIEDALGRLVLDLAVDLLDIDEIRITFADINVDSTVREQADPSGLVSVIGEGVLRHSHTIVAGSLSGTGTLLDIQASCGNYQYPSKTKCIRKVANNCYEWGTDYERYFSIEVIDKPLINSWRWEPTGYGFYNLVVEGKGFSATGHTFGIWEYNVLRPIQYDYDSLVFPGLTIIHGFRGSKPAWLNIKIWGENEWTGDRFSRVSESIFISASPDLEATLDFNNPSLYPGDTLYAAGNFFSSTETRLTLSHQGREFVELPSEIYYNSINAYDLLGFSIPLFNTLGYNYDGVTLEAHVKVKDGLPCQWYNCKKGEVKVLAHESAGNTSADDQDVIIYGPQRGSYLRSVVIGDLNGDGFKDLAVGVPNYYDNEGRNIGAVYILFGPIKGTPYLYGDRIIETIDLGAYHFNWDVQIIGDYRDAFLGGNSRRIGNSIAIGDINGDGIDDLLIGTRDQDEMGWHRPHLKQINEYIHIPGKAYLFYGRKSWRNFYGIWDANITFYGDEQRELGYQVGLGKIFGDEKLKDIVITAPTDSVDPNSPNQIVARTYVIKGWDTQSSNPDNLKFTIRLPDDLNTHPNFLVIEGKNYYQSKYSNFTNGEYILYKGDGMGKSLAIGDINGDGIDDLALGAPQYSRITPPSYPFNQEEGAVYIIFGSQSLRGYKYVYPTDGDQDTSIVGPKVLNTDQNTAFGTAVLIVDLNGDDRGEIIIGASSAKLRLDIYPHILVNPDVQSIAKIDEPGIGKIFIIDGTNPHLSYTYNNPNIADLIINGSKSISSFGYSLSSGDINNDGLKDLIVGAPGRRDGRGKVWVLYGSSSFRWKETSGQDVIHLENRRWYTDVTDDNYSYDAGRPLGEGFDYLIIGPSEHYQYLGIPPRFGTFVASGDLDPFLGDDILIISPTESAPITAWPDPVRAQSGMLYIFYKGSELRPLTIHPETVNMYFCDSEQEFIVSGGLMPYQFKWISCYQTYVGQPPIQIPGPVLCGEDFPLPSNFNVTYGENSVLLRIEGCIPNDLKGLFLKATDSQLPRVSVTREINFLIPDISISPRNINFGDVEVEWSVNLPITVSNTGNGALRINDISLTTESSDINIRNHCPQVLIPQDSCTIEAIFKPTKQGLATGSVSINSNDPDEGLISINLSGNGTITIAPNIVIIGGNLLFWNIPLGTSSAQDIIIKNDGKADLHINNVYLRGASEFSITSNNCMGAPIPPANPPYPEGTCKIRITFTPTSTGPVYGNIYIESNDPDTPTFIGSLSGNGVIPALYINPTEIDFRNTLTQGSFNITNSEWNCVDTLEWQIIPNLPSWLSVSPMSGSIYSCGGTQVITLQVNREGMPYGEYSHIIGINSNSGNGTVLIKMSVAGFISVAPASLNFAEAKKRLPLTIRNTSYSNTVLTWNISSALPSWLSASQTSGVISAGDSITVYLYANRSGLNQNQTYSHTLTITSNGGNITIPVSMTVPEPLATFAKYYGGDGGEYFSKIRQTSDGGFIAVGLTNSFGAGPLFSTEDAWVIKLDPSGYVEWEKTYGGYRYSERAYDIRQTSDGGYIMVAGTSSFTSDHSYGLWILKLDSYGDIEWQKEYGGNVNDNFGGWGMEFTIHQTPDLGYIVGGNTGNTQSGQRQDVWILKLDSSGNIQWQKSYGGSHDDYANSIQITSDGGYIIAGVTKSFNSEQKPDMWVLKLDGGGNVQWQKSYGGTGWDIAYDIKQTTDNGYILVGYSESYGSTMVLKLTSLGAIEWQKSYGGWDGYGTSIQQTQDGGYILTGSFYRAGRGEDIWVVKLNPWGNIEWQKTYGGNRIDVAYHIEQTPEGDYIVAGWTKSFRSTQYGPNYDAFVMKIDSIGNIGSSCGIMDLTSITPVETNIVVVDTSAIVFNSSTSPQNTNATVTDSSAVTDAVCSETLPQAGQRPLYAIDVSPREYDFGHVSIGNIASTIFTVENKGYNPLTITNIALSGSSDFTGFHTCPLTPESLGIAKRCEINVSFAPSVEGVQSANLYIESNDPLEQVIVIPITGSGWMEQECPPGECPGGEEPPGGIIIIR